MRALVLYLLLSVSFHVQALTIPKLSIYYNHKKISDLDLSKGNTFTLDSNNYKKGDFMAIQYFDDKKCSNCNYELLVVAEGKIPISTKKLQDKNQLIKLKLDNFYNHIKESKSKRQLFIIYLYTINNKGKRDNGPRLLTLYIES
jgi:hypothetical protein